MMNLNREKKKILKNDRESRSATALRKNLLIRKKQKETLLSKRKNLKNEKN
tara:strand:+ start:913 stop:1065 length:153 start_codon:yes stop_codon:yes gene_type:complete